MANVLSFIILVVFLWGRTLHKSNLRLHIAVMLGVILADLLLVIGLVEGRDALSKVNTEMPLILMIHVPIAITTVLLYFPTAWTGFQLAKGLPVRARLKKLDRALVIARVLTFVTSVLVQVLKT